MIKKIYISIFFGLSISSLWFFMFLTEFKFLYLNTLFFFVVLIFPILGILFTLPLIKQWGGLPSILGKALFFLCFSFIFNLAASLTLFFILKSFFADSIFTSILYYLTYAAWVLSAFYFLESTIITNKIYFWKKAAILLSLVSIFLIIYIFIMNNPLSIKILDITIFFTDLVLWSEVVVLFLMSSRLKGGRLFAPFLYFFLGIFFQLLGDLIYGIRELQNTIFMGDFSFYIYALSWFFLTMVPATFPKEP